MEKNGSYREEITDKLRAEFKATPFEIEVSGSVEIFIRSLDNTLQRLLQYDVHI